MQKDFVGNELSVMVGCWRVDVVQRTDRSEKLPIESDE